MIDFCKKAKNVFGSGPVDEREHAASRGWFGNRHSEDPDRDRYPNVSPCLYVKPHLWPPG